MKKILFPTDFSRASLNAFVYALHLAKKINAQIITLHVYEFPVGTPNDNFDFLLENYNIGKWGVFENFKSEVPKLRKIAEKEHLDKVDISHVLERGNVVDEIIHTAAKEKVDLIVLGTKGATGLKEIFLGTIAEKVIKRSKHTVIAVPSNYKFKPIKKILFLTEYEKMEMTLLKKVVDFANVLGASINVLEVSKHDERPFEDFKNKWRDHFNHIDITFSYINTNATEEMILEFINYQKINMAAMAIHHKNLFEKLFLVSISKKMAFHSTVPILGIPFS